MICREILEELTVKLQTKLDFMPDQIADTLADLLNALMLVTISGTLHVVAADPKDDMVIECGVVAGADYIVSGDRRHLLPLVDFQGIRIVSPAALLDAVADS